MSDEVRAFRDFAVLQRGFDLPVQDRVVGYVPVVASNGVVGWHSEAKVNGPGVVTGRSGTIGKVIFVEGDFWPLNTTLFVSDFKDNVPKFVALTLDAMDLASHAGGSTVPSLNRNVLDHVPVYCPAIPVQRRIVDLMSHLDAHIANLRAERDASVTMVVALRADAFSEPDSPSRRLGDLLEVVIDNRGKTPGKLGADFQSTGAPVISAVNVKGGLVVPSPEPRFIDDETYRRWMKTPTAKGDVLLTSEGPLGHVAQIPDDQPWVLGQRLFGLRGRKDSLLNDYLMHFLSSGCGQSALYERSSGSTVRGIRQAELVKVTVPWVPVEQQARVIAVLNAAVNTSNAIQGELERLLEVRTAALASLLARRHDIASDYETFMGWVA